MTTFDIDIARAISASIESNKEETAFNDIIFASLTQQNSHDPEDDITQAIIASHTDFETHRGTIRKTISNYFQNNSSELSHFFLQYFQFGTIIDNIPDGHCMIHGVLSGLDCVFSHESHSDILMRGLHIYFHNSRSNLLIERSDKTVITFNYQDTLDDRLIKVQHILDDNNLSSRCLQLLALACDVNIIVLSYDSKSAIPCVIQEYHCPERTFVFERITFSEPSTSKTIILLCNGGHYYTLVHDDERQFNGFVDLLRRSPEVWQLAHFG